MNEQILDRLKDMVAMDIEQLAKNAILPDGPGYNVFEIYSIQPTQGLWNVSRRGIEISVMTSLKSALSWCIADKYHQTRLSTDIIALDQQCRLTQSDIFVRSSLQKNIRDRDHIEAVNMKIYTRQLRLKSLSKRLEICVNQAKYLQIRGFNNETARSGRTSSNRPYR
jgi:hypothetical protein